MICGPDIQLTIDKDRVLGQGGHALVLRGEILNANKVTIAYNIANNHMCVHCTLTTFRIINENW